MNTEKEHIIISNTLIGVCSERLEGYICHAYCHIGQCSFKFNEQSYVLQAGDCLIVRRVDLITDVCEDNNLRVDVIYVSAEFIELCTPQSNYGMKGQLALFNNPIMHLTPEQQQVCILDFDYIKRRLALTTHHFHRDVMINAVQCLIIDFFDFHASLYGDVKISSPQADIMERFLQMLEQGDYRHNRDIGYYADRLYVTPKYLSEVSKSVSGYSANYWIKRYTSLDISRCLRQKNYTLSELADIFGFSSTGYLSRYVQKNLGLKPSELRE
ncbi:MAG: AraC family transcriptional regulator [Bacteroidales bacterium]|nr:AraC family transcriptional regulator [Bacteroidales bacterium]